MNTATALSRGLLIAAFALAVLPRLCIGAEAAVAPAADDSLHRALGGQLGIARVVDDLTRRLVDDPRTAAMFREVDLAQFRSRLADQLCQIVGGPCVYKGKDMKTVHDGVDITKAHFNAVVEMLQDAMDAEHIAFREQNRLLARLAPMHRDIVTDH